MPFQFVSIILAFALGAAPTGALPARPPLARLDLGVTTSAPQTTVRLTPGTVLATRTSTTSSGVTAVKLKDGWVIKNASGGQVTVSIRTVFATLKQVPFIWMVLATGGGGRATARLTNTSAAPVVVAQLASSAEVSTRRLFLRRSAVFGATDPVVHRPDHRRLVLAAYYPWFGAAYGNPLFYERPADPRSTTDLGGVLSMTQQAKANGIDGFLCSWAGQAKNGANFDLVLRAAEQAGSLAGPYLATLGANAARDPNAPADPAIVEAWLDQALARADSPAFLRSDGVPVVFVYQMKTMTPAQWTDVLARLRARGRSVKLVGDAGMLPYGASEWGYHIYSPHTFSPGALSAWNRGHAAEAHLLASPAKLYVATVGPGYDARKVRPEETLVVERGANGERYAATWQAALVSAADWVLVTSWNEWFEATTVEPGEQTGDLALRQTAVYAARFKDPARPQPVG